MDPSGDRTDCEGLSVPCGLRDTRDIVQEGVVALQDPLNPRPVRAEGGTSMSRSGAVTAVTATKRVVKHGASLGLNLSREFALLGTDYGDLVEVTIKPAKGDEDR